MTQSIVGWIVFDPTDIEHAALYPLSQKEQAFDAAKRWGNCIQALVVHPATPELQK